MYLAIMLIVVTLLVFYNEINNKMDLSEYMLLAITFIAIIKAAINYIKINKEQEGFEANNSNYLNKNRKNKAKTNNNNNNNNNKTYKDEHEFDQEEEDLIIIKSEDSDEYLDSDELPYKNRYKNKNSFTSLTDVLKTNQKDTRAIKNIDNILYSESLSKFTDIPVPSVTSDSAFPTDPIIYDNKVASSFNPKVIIGKGKNNNDYDTNSTTGFGSMGDSSAWNSAFKNDGFKFNNTMYPNKNLWRDHHSYYNSDTSDSSCDQNVTSTVGINPNDWTQSMDEYNKGLWNKNLYTKASDYIDYTNFSINNPVTTKPTPTSVSRFEDVPTPTPTSTSTPTPTSSHSPTPTATNSKKCGKYDTTYENDAGDLLVKDYTESKKWVAGYTYVPPVFWDVPQKHTSICNPNGPNVHKLTGLMDRGLPINALELNDYGKIASTEDTVNLTNVGSMVQKFNYQEQPFSKPYV